MSRLSRKNRTDLGIKSSGGMSDLMDNAMKQYLRVDDNEYDFILEKACDQEDNGDSVLMHLLVSDNKTFAEKRQLLTITNQLIHEVNEDV